MNYKFTGQELDSETGLYNYNARLYDPSMGRFLTPDTIVPDPTNPQSLNRYSYVMNNPLNYTDPTGHCGGEGDPCPPLNDSTTSLATGTLNRTLFLDIPNTNVQNSNWGLLNEIGGDILDVIDWITTPGTSPGAAPSNTVGGVGGNTNGGTGGSGGSIDTSNTYSTGGSQLSSISSSSGGWFSGAIDYYTIRSQANSAAGNYLAAAVDKAGVFAMGIGMPNSFAGVPLMLIGGTELKGAKFLGNELHHLLPQAKALKPFFEKAGLNIEKYTVELSVDAHRLRPNGLHTGSNNWNKVWSDFFRNNPGAGRDGILDQLERMKNQFNIP